MAQYQNLTWEQKDQIDQVTATMAIEAMPLTEQTKQELIDIIIGKKTIEQSIKETKKRYNNV